jgi:hypothetical protein
VNGVSQSLGAMYEDVYYLGGDGRGGEIMWILRKKQKERQQ